MIERLAGSGKRTRIANETADALTLPQQNGELSRRSTISPRLPPGRSTSIMKDTGHDRFSTADQPATARICPASEELSGKARYAELASSSLLRQ